MRILKLFVAAALCLAAASARAGDAGDDGWHLDFTGYVWMPSFHGSTGVRGIDIPVSASFGDILRNSDSLVGLEGRLALRNGPFGVYVDGLWNRVGLDTVTGPFGLASIQPTATLTYVEGALFYQFLDVAPDRSPDSQDFWGAGIKSDVYAGARYTDIGLKLKFQNLGQSESKNQSWVDPIVGARVELSITDDWRFFLDNNVGGFGAGSKFAYSGLALVGYQFTLWDLPTTVWVGYRGLYQNFQDGNGSDAFKWNMWVHGPVIASTIRFF
jgi:hypothetical protein